jgi:hypothetical protein
VRVAVESDNELNGTVASVAATTRAGDLGFPIGLFLVETAKRLPALGDGRPGLVRAGHIGDETACGNRDLAMLQGLPFGHAETASLFSGGGEFGWGLGIGFRRLRHEEAKQQQEPERQKGKHAAHVRMVSQSPRLRPPGMAA